MDKLRVGIVGCGRIAGEIEDGSEMHPISIAGGFDALDDTKIVAACSRGKERLNSFGRRWKVDSLYHDYTEMIRKERPDIVAIATHPPIHAEIVEAACAGGVRGIFCEKPMALDLLECDRIIRAVEKSGVRLLVDCSRRFSGLYESVRRLCEKRELGELIHMVGHCQGAKPSPEWQAEAEGPLLHDAVHLFDIMRFFAGDALSLVGTAANPTRRYRVEDTSHSIIEFAGGVEGVAVVDEMAEFSDFSLELNYTRGRIRLSGKFNQGFWLSVPNATRKSLRREDTHWHHLEERPLPKPAWEGTNMLHAVTNLVRAVQKDEPIRCDVYDGRASIEMIMAIYESQVREGARVRLPLESGHSPLQILRERGIL